MYVYIYIDIYIYKYNIFTQTFTQYSWIYSRPGKVSRGRAMPMREQLLFARTLRSSQEYKCFYYWHQPTKQWRTWCWDVLSMSQLVEFVDLESLGTHFVARLSSWNSLFFWEPQSGCISFITGSWWLMRQTFLIHWHRIQMYRCHGALVFLCNGASRLLFTSIFTSIPLHCKRTISLRISTWWNW